MSNMITLSKFYDVPLVILSVLIAIIGSYVTLTIVQKLEHTRNKRIRRIWRLAGAGLLGLSIWSMHFLGMSALELQVALSYEWLITFLSIAPAVLAAYVAFYQLSRKYTRPLQRMMAALLMGAGIAIMHYSGMRAIHYGGIISYDPVLFGASILIAIVASYAALVLFQLFSQKQSRIRKLSAALVMGFAISCMHYTGMNGTEFCIPANSGPGLPSLPVFSSKLLLISLLVVLFLILLMVLALTSWDRTYYQRLVYYDSLTGLPNKRQLRERLEQFQDRSQHKSTTMSLYLIDIDRFRWINESLGYEVGNQLLCAVSLRLKQRFRTELLGKLDANTFGFAKLAQSEEQIRQTAADIAAVFKEPFLLNGHQIVVTASIGIDSGPVSTEDRFATFRRATLALQYSKETGRNRFTLYKQELHSKSREIEIGYQMRQALQNNEFYLCFQPKINLTTGQADSAEVLARWKSPIFGEVSPGEFIPIAEQNGMITDLTEWIVKQACTQMKQWLQLESPIKKVAINLSAIHFQLENAEERLIRIIKDANISPSCIEFEITETAVMHDIERAVIIIERLRSHSISIALDDFGTGVSSLTYLKSLPIDTLKIDKSFIDFVPNAEKDTAILEMIISLTKYLKFEIVVEGVEDEVQARFLKQAGCHYAQGYYFSRPLPAADVTHFQPKALVV